MVLEYFWHRRWREFSSNFERFFKIKNCSSNYSKTFSLSSSLASSSGSVDFQCFRSAKYFEVSVNMLENISLNSTKSRIPFEILLIHTRVFLNRFPSGNRQATPLPWVPEEIWATKPLPSPKTR